MVRFKCKMCVYIYIYIYTHTHVYIYIYIYIHMCSSISVVTPRGPPRGEGGAWHGQDAGGNVYIYIYRERERQTTQSLWRITCPPPEQNTKNL